MIQDILLIISNEFSDLTDMSEVARITTRLIVAAVLGGAVGYQREINAKDAGIRTHMLVAVGTALFVIAPLKSGASINDMTRVFQGVVQGIGFLGAGAIVLGSSKIKTRGLTTAASIWTTAGIGVAAGLGKEATAVLSTIIILFILAIIPYIPRLRKSTQVNEAQAVDD